MENGKGENCYAIDDAGNLEPFDCAGGGIYSHRGVSATDVHVSDNGGPGINAESDIYMRRITIRDNKGDGVRAGSYSGGGSGVGVVEIDTDSVSYSEISGNQGRGIRANGCGTESFFIKGEAAPKKSDCLSVEIYAPVLIYDNAGWGIEAEEGILMGVEGVDINGNVSPLKDVSTVKGNGKGDICYQPDQQVFIYCPARDLTTVVMTIFIITRGAGFWLNPVWKRVFPAGPVARRRQ